jgi:hypothetical protein
MRVWTLLATTMLSTAALTTGGCPPVRAEQPASLSASTNHAPTAAVGTTGMPMDMGVGGTNDQTSRPGQAGAGQAAFELIKQLVGKWEAPMGNNKTIVDIFQLFAFGAAILAEEWVDGQQITSTVFYMVGPDLRADHYCDYLNQPRYVAVPSADPTVVDFEFRDATNLDTHPRHFHSTTWHLVDTTHLTQDWDVEGGPKGKGMVHLAFVRQQ